MTWLLAVLLLVGIACLAAGARLEARERGQRVTRSPGSE